MASSEAAIIASASAIGGGLIVAVSNYTISRLQAREANKAELRHALIELWYILSRIDHRLRIEPEGGKTARIVNKQMASRWPLLDHAIGLTRRRLLEPDLDAFVVEMHKAMAAASMLAPLKLLPAMTAVTEAMEHADDRDSAWQEKWNKARTDYFIECREFLGPGVRRIDPSLSDLDVLTG